MWSIISTDTYERRLKKYHKKHPRELMAVLRNLNRFSDLLNTITNPQLIEAGYVHHEPQGVKAIDQKGGGKDLKQTRLYIYTYEKDKMLHLITLGDKKTQSEDLAYCKEFMKQFTKE
jgi:hypothetical protein